MLLTKELEVLLHPRNMKYYEGLGYNIPKIKGEKWGKIITPKGTKIKVKIEDLMKGSNLKIEYLCDYCKENIISVPYYEYYSRIKKGETKDCCKQCIGKKVSERTKTPIGEVIKRFNDYNFEVLDGIEQYNNDIEKDNKFLLKCLNGHFWETSLDNFRQVLECPECTGHKKPTYEDIFNYYKQYDCELLTNKKEYKHTKQMLNYRCKCGSVYAKRFDAFKKSPNCPNCSSKPLYDTEKVRDIFAEYNYKLLSEYKDNKLSLEYICDKGHYGSVTLSNFLNGARCMQCYLENNHGENHPSWNPNKTAEERLEDRKYEEYSKWRQEVFKRDYWTCQKCGYKKGKIITAHHKDGYDWCKERRLDVDNGITLCKDCHALSENSFHRTYGFGKNTEQQFNEWLTLDNQKVI